MSNRETYNDAFSGTADKGIKAILEGKEEDDTKSLRRIMLKVINNNLTARQKEIIMLYYFKNENTTEISQRLGVSPQAVSAAMARARLRMLRILQYYI
jgi:RNA polymerase sigma-70 factor (ECF subfamily)